MPSDQMMAQWEEKPSKAPKQVQKNLGYGQSKSKGSVTPLPAGYHGGGGKSAPGGGGGDEHRAPEQKPQRTDPAGVIYGQSEGIDLGELFGHIDLGFDIPKPSWKHFTESRDKELAGLKDWGWVGDLGLPEFGDNDGEYLKGLEGRGGRAASGGRGASSDGGPKTFDEAMERMRKTHSGGRSANGPVIVGEQAREAAMAERAKVAGVAKRERREDILGIAAGALSTTPEKLREMTEEQYYDLSPDQRAAVDFNTMLSTAVNKDERRREHGKYDDISKQHQMNYDATVGRLFGEEGGSDLYAPETVAVLSQLELKDKSADLDDYLQLKVAITDKDLKRLENPQTKDFIGPPTPQVEREGLLAGQIDATQELQAKLVKGQQMLQDWQTTAAADRAAQLKQLGTASPGATRPAAGFGKAVMGEDMNREGYFQQAFDSLSLSRDPKEQADVLTRIKNDMAIEGDDFSMFAEYVDDRTSNSKFYDAELGLGTNKVKYLPAERYRELLGLSE
jgi:hypothetical protein